MYSKEIELFEQWVSLKGQEDQANQAQNRIKEVDYPHSPNN